MADLGELTGATETALIVPVPAVEPVVRPHRRALDHSAQWGVPAHVTVLYPFRAPARVTEQVIDEVSACVTTIPAFECVFSRVAWFGQDVVWLAPEPDAPFRALTAAVWNRFPDCPPYAGAHSDPVPHLTIGSTRRARPAQLRLAAAEVAGELPVRARVRRMRLIAGTDAPDSWRTVARFELPGQEHT
ncbi:2'-5' RNA ligase family protein [Sciscionella sediminilitoris]|uniref:2'-5' RNA ligase family protein n=1 Tax=Sciscionella sediminilitoris TaxID=1445613 RepID=UPI0004DEE005|nr:2'-5' RNA ligase family protein [Sciscionella sp. SE31]